MDSQFKPLDSDDQIVYLVHAARTLSEGWTDLDLQVAFKKCFPDKEFILGKPFVAGRPGGFRNQIHRHCQGYSRYSELSPGPPRPPFFELQSKNTHRLNPNWPHLLPANSLEAIKSYLHSDFDSWVEHPILLDEDDEDDEEANAIERAIVTDLTLSDTERKSQIDARRGQGKYRKNLLKFERKCRITGISNPVALLIASHTKPWKKCETAQERLDVHNGFLFTPTYDRLFDKGYMTFEDNGDVVLSKRLDRSAYELLGVRSMMNVGSFTSQQKHYLAYHRQHVFKSAHK